MGSTQDIILEYLRTVHLIGLCAGFGGVIFADFLGLSLLFSRRRLQIGSVLSLVHWFVFSGLAVIWMSGLVIAAMKFGLQDMPAKLIAKLILTSALTGNAFLIHRYLLPIAEQRPAPLVANFSGWEIMIASFCGSLSFAGWFSILLIAKISLLQQQSVPMLLLVAGSFWLICLTVLAVMMLAGAKLFSMTPERDDYEPQDARFLDRNLGHRSIAEPTTPSQQTTPL